MEAVLSLVGPQTLNQEGQSGIYCACGEDDSFHGNYFIKSFDKVSNEYEMFQKNMSACHL